MRKYGNYLPAVLVLLSLTACERGTDTPASAAGTSAAPSATDAQFLAEDAAWRAQRKEDLLKPDGWTSLIGLHWLELKAHYLGSSPGSGIRLAMGPAKMGLLQQNEVRLFFTPERGTVLTLDGKPLQGRVELGSDHDEAPSVIGFDEGKGVLTVIQRGERRALRVKHAEAPTRLQFTGLDYWPADASWKIEGKFVPHPAGKTIPIVDIVGTSTDTPNPGAVEFVRDGKTLRVEALQGGDNTLFVVLADRTSGHGSYPAGRFLDAPAPDAQGRVVLDFNRAYNPPCAFTSFATCPLPPSENRLDLAITAGEKTYNHPATP